MFSGTANSKELRLNRPNFTSIVSVCLPPSRFCVNVPSLGSGERRAEILRRQTRGETQMAFRAVILVPAGGQKLP